MFSIFSKKTAAEQRDPTSLPNHFRVVMKQEVIDLKALTVFIRTKTDTYCCIIRQELRPYTADYSLHTGRYVHRQTEEHAGHTIHSMLRHHIVYPEWCGLHPNDDAERYYPGNPFATFQLDDGTTVTIPSADILEIKQTIDIYTRVTKSVETLERI
jgi:hypothetical protein